jgi:AcrR family transcriptional regulator
LRFSPHSYEATGLRDIAADAEVDVAYVHRCFGSKEKLFREALEATIRPDRLFAGSAEGLATSLAHEVLRERKAGEIRSFDIIIHSFSSPEVARVLADILSEDFIAPLIEKWETLSATRATLVTAFLAGIGILRDVIRAAPLQNDSTQEFENITIEIIDYIMTSAGKSADVKGTHSASSE